MTKQTARRVPATPRSLGRPPRASAASGSERSRLAGKRRKPSRARPSKTRERTLVLGTALEMARLTNVALAKAGLEEAVVVGEARRGVALLRELTMIVRATGDTRAVVAALKSAIACHSIHVEGADTVRMQFAGGGPAAVRVVPSEHFVEALVRETGSATHVGWLESRAEPLEGLSAACARVDSEQALYALLGVPFPAAELREGPTPRVPELVKEVRGVFHVHTTWSDGAASIVEMAQAALEAGFGYMGLTEHSKAAIYARGLDAEHLRAQAGAVEEARAAVPGVTIFHGVEVDILPDGSLDLDDTTLSALDFVVASVHLRYDMTSREMTARLVRAVSHPLVTILGHPTGRLLLGRKGYSFDIEAVADAAAANDTFLEINANPQRLDLCDALVRRAAARGARFAIDPDAHSPRGLRDTALGLMLARRAGLTRAQILNTRGPRAMVAYLSERRRRASRALASAPRRA